MDGKSGVEITAVGDAAALVRFTSAAISDVEGIVSMSAQIRKYASDNKVGLVVFDFSGVRFFSSQVLGMLLEVRQEVEPWGGKVVVSAIDPQLHRVFRITGLDKVFEFFEDGDSALEGVE